jgi:hypothetical protein
MIQAELLGYAETDPAISAWLEEMNDKDQTIAAVADLPALDKRRLAALNPKLLRRVVTSRKGIHVKVASTCKVLLDMALLQRSLASVLPVSQGEPIALRGLFKKWIRKTAVVERTREEEVEYQFFHREAAR